MLDMFTFTGSGSGSNAGDTRNDLPLQAMLYRVELAIIRYSAQCTGFKDSRVLGLEFES